jgi:adhesin/invasin
MTANRLPLAVGSHRALTATIVAISLAACSHGDGAPSERIVIAKYAGDNQSVVGGLPVPIAPAVRVTSNNQPAAGDTVTFAIADLVPGPGGAMLTGAVQVTGADGVATVGGWIPGSAGGHFLMASIIGSSATPVTFDATAIQYALVVNAVAGNGQSAPAGSAVPIAPRVKVLILTATMELVPLVDTTVTFTVGAGGGSVTGAVTKTDADGMASVGSWTLGVTPGLNTLLVRVSPLNDVQVTFAATGTP